MSLIEFQAWLPDSDLSGAPDHTFATDGGPIGLGATPLVDAGFNPVLWGEGDGFIEIHADDASTQYLQRRGFIRAVRTDTDEGLFWWILEEGSVKLVSTRGQVEKVIRWDGRGMLYYLDRYKLGQAVWAPGQPFRGSVNVFDYWTWVDQPMIAILTRFMEEGQNDTRAEFLNKLDYDFSRVVDSNGNSLTALEEYQVRIGTGGLTLASDAMRQGNLLQVLPESPPLLQAFRDVAEYRTDRSSATFAADKVRFAAAQNIATELPHKIVALRERTHTLTRRKDGQYATEDVDGSGVPYMEFLEVPFTSDPVVVEEVVSQSHLARQAQSTVAVIRHKLGPGGASGAQGYFPSPAGHYWVGDLVTAHSGTGEYDLNEQALEVAGIRYFLRGADWMVEAQLGAQVINAAGGPVSVPNAGPTIPRSPDLRICRDPIEGEAGEGTSTRWYPTGTPAGTSPYTALPDLGPGDVAAAWDADSLVNYYALSATAVDGASTETWDQTNPAVGTRSMRGYVSPALAGDALAAIQNGCVLRSQLRAGSRNGIGVDESIQEDYAAICVRLYRPGTGFLATLFDVARVNENQFPADPPNPVNRSFPATLAAFPTAAGTDHLVIDYGIDHVSPTSGVGNGVSGTRLYFMGTTTDLPQNNSTTTANRPWVEIAESTTSASYPGSLPEPIVLPGEESHGDCDGAASCCHTHAHGEFGADGALHTFSQVSGDLDLAYLQLPEGSAPSTPPAGTARVYVKSDGRVYSMDEGGIEYGPFDAAGGGGCSDPAAISGGTHTSSGGWEYYAFTSSGTLTVTVAGLVDVLLVGGGGGGGGYFSGGGGGGGQVKLFSDIYVDANVTVTVGAGGGGGGSSDNSAARGSNGDTSSFGQLQAIGGGGGGGDPSSESYQDGQAGASGGGGGGRNSHIGGAGYLGNAGGTSRTGSTGGTGGGGGGGGAGSAGADAGASNNGAAGGNGTDPTDFDSFGASGFFGGGGGGGGVTAGGAGGSGGGGAGGGTSANPGTNGTANTGGGGGGGGNTGTSGTTGGSGGSGIVIVRVPS